VSRLFAERLSVTLAPDRVTAGRRTIACDPSFGREPWQGAIAALQTLEWRARSAATAVLSNHFVRYLLVPWSDAVRGEAEEGAYLRHHFRKVHGDRANDWVLRSSEAPRGAPRLASAIDAALLDALKATFPKGGKARLVSVQPALMAAFNRHRGAIPASGAWLALAEPDRACVALHAGGEWRAVQNGKGAWLALLERERHRVEGEVPDVVLLQAEGLPAAAAPGWNLHSLT
jgi:hypothetical protein